MFMILSELLFFVDLRISPPQGGAVLMRPAMALIHLANAASAASASHSGKM
jgi:hypothetical protein